MGTRLLTRRRSLLESIARKVGTPVYVYDAEAIRDRYTALDAALAPMPHRLYYSVKASSGVALLGVLRKLGAGVDVVSVGEMARAFRAGFRAGDIVFSGVGKRADELEQAVGHRIRSVNVESTAEFDLLREIAERRSGVASFGIRMNPDVATSTHPYTQTGEASMKFGVPMDEVLDIAWAAMRSPGLRLTSVGMHIGSQICDAAHYREGAARLLAVVRELRNMGLDTLESVDVGGGIGIRYRDETPLDPAAFADAVRPLVAGTGLHLAVEPGRYLVGNAGHLLTRCLYRKRAGGKTFVIADAGVNDMIRASLYGATHEVVVVAPGQGPPADREPVDVVGPVCETGDFLAKDRSLPDAVPGALLAVCDVGAYGFTMSSNYNSRPRAPEVLVDGDLWAVVRERESLDDLMRGESTLDQLDSQNAWTRATSAGARTA
ncbi:MAG: diaminopimelate decarboxylase [Gemmatimonadales bacterium]|nr:diaminopimelate decarboxylase [Gemmatimonadales bacterium]